MGYFDLPRGELELQLKDGKGIHWESVCFTDRLDKETLAMCKEEWSERHEVLAARYNGKEVEIPTNYHWDLRHKDVVFGSYKTREEAVNAMHQRKSMWRKDKTVKIGLPYFAEA